MLYIANGLFRDDRLPERQRYISVSRPEFTACLQAHNGVPWCRRNARWRCARHSSDQVLATMRPMPFRHRVAAMVQDLRDKFLGVPESLVVAWHARLSHHYQNMEHGDLSPSHQRAMEPSMSSTCSLLSELPSITVAHFLSCLKNRSSLNSLELYETTLQALARNPHFSVSPHFRCWKEGPSLWGMLGRAPSSL